MPGGNPDIDLKTLSNRELLEEVAAELRALRALREDLAPLLALAKSTNGGTVGLLRARKAARGG